MSLSNDHYYGHVHRYIVENNVTWLECAACCTVWSTMLVYYLEAPYGHLIDVPFGQPDARTKVKGNLFSFSMPWEDIERCCREASQHAEALHPDRLKLLQENLGVPHSEETLAMLVNVHIVGGSKDLALHVKGLTLRIPVMQKLMEIMRDSGYPGYGNDGLNSFDRVAARLHERYSLKYAEKYGEAKFTPQAVQDAVRHLEKTKGSIVQDKVATPPEPAKAIERFVHALSPSYLVAERSSKSQSNMAENYKSVFAKFGDVNLQTGTEMTNQHTSWYLGMAFPFTLPRAVGGYDVPNRPRWRRPETNDLPTPRSLLRTWLDPPAAFTHRRLPDAHFAVGAACEVKLFDITRGLPQRIEGQFRRTWGFAPALWNLYFRECVNLGASLSIKRGQQLQGPGSESVETDAAIAAASLLQKLEKGHYRLPDGRRRKINNDASKLLFAVGLSEPERRLVADFRFRCQAIPGTQDIRTKIGHLGFWAGVNYGSGIFCTILLARDTIIWH